MDNEKHERFLRVAENRTKKAINFIRLLGNCANTNNYTYTEGEIDKIFSALDVELKRTKALFKKNDAILFKLR